MKIFIIGDIVGNTGVNKVKEVLPNLIKSENIVGEPWLITSPFNRFGRVK